MSDKIVKAVIEFEDGKTVNLNLYPDVAPLSVDNFTALAEKKYFDGLCFHRVIPSFMIQGGGFKQWGIDLAPAPALKPIKGEFDSNGVKNGLKHKTGVISMARTMVKDSATSQFFICVADCPFLDGEYAAFGECADPESVKAAVEISTVKTRSLPQGYDDVPVEPVVIKTIRIER